MLGASNKDMFLYKILSALTAIANAELFSATLILAPI